MMRKVAIVGIVGLPANYGGFETLVDNLVSYHSDNNRSEELTVYCSKKSYATHSARYKNAQLKYMPFYANGVQSVLYDGVSLIDATRKADCILVLGVSGAMIIPLLRLFFKGKVVTNIDGIEWRREKWSRLAKTFLRFSEKMAVRFSHIVIADNEAIADHVKSFYGASCEVIAYGGDHAISNTGKAGSQHFVPNKYALSLCRIEPENNVELILDAYSKMPNENLVFVGNWDNSSFGKELKEKYSLCRNIVILDPVYDQGELFYIRSKASLYVHGHSAGGTNPSLVEMMHFGIPVVAFDCDFNRYTTEGKSLYFSSSDGLVDCLSNASVKVFNEVSEDMKEVAMRKYAWHEIGRRYFDILEC